jgi:hypothetical protein
MFDMCFKDMSCRWTPAAYVYGNLSGWRLCVHGKFQHESVLRSLPQSYAALQKSRSNIPYEPFGIFRWDTMKPFCGPGKDMFRFLRNLLMK